MEQKLEAQHKNGVIQLLIQPSENLLFTISFDRTLKWFEASKLSMQFEMINPNKACYSCMVWDSVDKKLYVGDDKGFLYIIDVYDEDQIITKDLRGSAKLPFKITRLEIVGD